MRKALFDKEDDVVLASAKIALFYEFGSQLHESPNLREFLIGFAL